MTKYIPMDLAFEHYAHVKQEFNALEYAKICAEMVNPRYAPVTEAEGLALYMRRELILPDRVRVIWMHDVERPSDNFLARRMAEMEHDFGFRSSYNVRVVSVIDPTWRKELFRIRELGHELQYQHEDLVTTGGNQEEALESFRKNLAYLRTFFPEITLAFGHGVYKSGIASQDLFKCGVDYDPALLESCGLPPFGELYFFITQLRKELGERFHFAGESSCIGGDEFAAALRDCRPGEVIMFLQHPTWWSDNYDFEELKKIMRTSVFFH